MTNDRTNAEFLEAARAIKRTRLYRRAVRRHGRRRFQWLPHAMPGNATPIELEDDWVADMIAQHCCMTVSEHAAYLGTEAIADESADMAWQSGYCGRKGNAYGIDPLAVLAILKVVIRLWLWWRERRGN